MLYQCFILPEKTTTIKSMISLSRANLVDDETGASFWPAYPGLIAVDGSAAVRFEGVDISPYAGVAGTSTPYMIVITDSAGKKIWGYLAEADGTLALGADIFGGNGDCATDFFDLKGTGWSHDAGNEEYDCDGSQATGTNLQENDILTIGKLCKIVFTVRNYITGTITPLAGKDGLGMGQIADGTYTEYIVCLGNTNFYLYANSSFDGSVDDNTVQEVTALGADGCHVVSTKNGSTRNWANKEAGFDYNDSSGYTFEIKYIRPQHPKHPHMELG